MRLLAVVPHLDDEAISCGGLIQVRVEQGWDVGVLCVYGRMADYENATDMAEEEQDFLAAKKLLGFQRHWFHHQQEGEPSQVGYYKVLEVIEKALSYFEPQEVVGPSPEDLNQDHRFLAHVRGIALRPVNLRTVRKHLEFIALDGTVQSPTFFVPLTQAHVDTKLASVAAYRKEARGGTSPRAPENMIAQMRVWGSRCGHAYAEGYRLRFARETDEDCNYRQLGVHRHEPDAVSGENRA